MGELVYGGITTTYYSDAMLHIHTPLLAPSHTTLITKHHYWSPSHTTLIIKHHYWHHHTPHSSLNTITGHHHTPHSSLNTITGTITHHTHHYWSPSHTTLITKHHYWSPSHTTLITKHHYWSQHTLHTNLELVSLQNTLLINVIFHLMQDSQHGDVGLAGTSGGRDE